MQPIDNSRQIWYVMFQQEHNYIKKKSLEIYIVQLIEKIPLYLG